MSQATMKVQPKTKDQQTGAHAVLTARRIVAYAVLILLCALCLFFFYVLIINATRPHADIQKGFSFLPGSWTSLCNNFTQVINNANIPILSGMRNSLIVSAMTAILACYFSALTAFGIHAYRFKGRTLALTFILLIMTMPTQVSALGFVQLMGKMNLKDSLLPLFLPSIASPAVFYFMHQYMQASLPLEVIEAARIDGSSEFADFDCSAPQRRLPEVRHGAGLYDDCPLDSPRHHRLPLPQQVHHCWRRGRRREGVRGFPKMNAPSLFAVREGGGRAVCKV